MTNIQKQSRRARMLFQFFLTLTPIMVSYYWLTVGTPYDYLTSFGVFQATFNISSYTLLPLSITTRALSFIASLLFSGITMYALMILIRLFKNYERGDIFSLDNASYFQKLGYTLFYFVIGSIIYDTLMSVILSFNNPPGQRMLTISFVGINFLSLIFAFIILIISWVMKEAHIIADENKNTI